MRVLHTFIMWHEDPCLNYLLTAPWKPGGPGARPLGIGSHYFRANDFTSERIIDDLSSNILRTNAYPFYYGYRINNDVCMEL